MATKDQIRCSLRDDSSDSDDEFFDALANETAQDDVPEPSGETSKNDAEEKETNGADKARESLAGNIADEVEKVTPVGSEEASSECMSDSKGNERTLHEGPNHLTDTGVTTAAGDRGNGASAGVTDSGDVSPLPCRDCEDKGVPSQETDPTPGDLGAGDCSEALHSQEELQNASSIPSALGNPAEGDAPTHEGLEMEEKEPEAVDEAVAETAEDIVGEVNEEELRREREDAMTEEEREMLKDEAQEHKAKGNDLFKQDEFLDAISTYSQALELCPLCFKKERSIMFANRAACRLRQKQYEEAIGDCNKALELHPHYLKVWLRRANTYEVMEKLDEALADFQKVLELDPGCYEARAACMRLPDQIKERNEKLKEEMFGKLKELGNMVLRPFGLSTENFQFQQDPNSGSYSVNFQQNPAPGNGK